MRDLGGAGEGIVESWCSIAGITANRSLKDRYGWDFIFEMQSPNDIRSAAGLHESNIECKVQIKTTDGDARSQQITLSNLKAMATTPLPAFYLLLEYAQGLEPVGAFLLHVDNEHCEKILKRIRMEASRPGKLDLNKKKMSLKFTDEMQISPLNGEGIRSAIMRYVGNSQGKYVEQKQHFLRSAGYGDGAISVHFEIKDSNLQKFVSMVQGHGGKIEVQRVASFETRFGVQEERVELRSETAIIEVSNVVPDSSGELRFRNKLSGEQYAFEVDVYRAGSASWIPPHLRTIRLKAQYFQVELGVNTNTLNISFDDIYDQKVDAFDLLKMFRFMNFLKTLDGTEMAMRFGDINTGGTLSGDGLTGDFEKEIKLLERMQAAKEYYNYYDPLLITENNFTKFFEAISAHHKVITDQAETMSISFTLPDSDIDSAECLVGLPLIVGDICFVSLHAFTGLLEKKENNTYCLDVKTSKPIYRTYIRVNEISDSSVLADLKAAGDAYKSDLVKIDMSQMYVTEAIEWLGSPSRLGN